MPDRDWFVPTNRDAYIVRVSMLAWRTGDPAGRGMYAVLPNHAISSLGDSMFVGVMESRELAEHVVETHNVTLL